ncbi:TonB-dependent receptor plug domain-containing protein [Flavobacterium sp. NST-5]|uniref:TonB-dependent receptor plug domain-containing protein n=1 Tax=Flavobacterium ichthyis TaxID=2698827 RepID=A0ABW9Z9Y0_9FLAO|nr:TonB-dependent receptor [Flavobacterium ichthyis]NBL64961.1 TonB-dependent receptor plug domain-containing protein [Flavobacterium ichthyis]
MKSSLIIWMLFLCSFSALAQNKISGTVTDDNGLPLPAANVTIVGETVATSTDMDGKFSIETSQNPPVTLKISSVGFADQTLEVTDLSQVVTVAMFSQDVKLDEIVVSASRTAERVMESPVTIERMGIQDVKNTTAPTFYDNLENLKEVHFNTSSLSFKTVNTRGFAAVGNTRFMQLVDGMDNSSPALNFVLGNLIGLSELDVQSVELLPGASSALYGANAFNGILFMNSKSPFTHQGLSVYAKYGKTNQKLAGTNDYWDIGLRGAHAFSEKVAAKVNLNILGATEWYAGDTRDMTGTAAVDHSGNPNYDGLNYYGDEVTTNIRGVGTSLANLGLIPAAAVNFLPNMNVSRTGYREQDITDNKVESVKADMALHIRPMEDDFEIILQSKLGFGSTIYQGANRYMLKNFLMQQHKFEVKNRNFFARIYATTEDAGDSYDMRFTGWNINRAWKSDSQWFGEYAGAFVQATLAGVTDEAQKHAIARAAADTGRFLPGSADYKNAFNNVTANPDLTQGSKFTDNSKLYHADANYNFKELTDWAEIQVGGSWRQYVMNSDGSIFTDYDGPIRYNEYGAYTQLTKRFLAEERLKFTGSIRYDKSQNFDGNFSPRISFVYSAGARKEHNFRVSYQTGFRNPTTQDQYIGLDLGPFALIGSAPDNLTRFVEDRPVSIAGQAFTGGAETVTLDGRNAYGNAYTVPSVQAFAATGDVTRLQVAQSGLVEPEKVQAFELGYRSVINNDLTIDINGYYNIYNDFLSTARVIAPYYGTVGTDFTNPQTQATLAAIQNGDTRVYQVYTNSNVEITSLGFGVGLSKKIYKEFELSASYNFAEFDFDQEKDPAFIAGFNTPKHRIKAGLGNPEIFKNFGANFNVRYNSEYLWQSSFGDGMIPENVVFDAQISYSVPSIKSTFKFSASNLFGDDYLQVIGSGMIGQQYLLSWTINP